LTKNDHQASLIRVEVKTSNLTYREMSVPQTRGNDVRHQLVLSSSWR